MTLGDDPSLARALVKYKQLHVRVSIKGTDPDMFHELTGAYRPAYELPFVGLRNLINSGVSCNACLMVSFSDKKGVADAKQNCSKSTPGC